MFYTSFLFTICTFLCVSTTLGDVTTVELSALYPSKEARGVKWFPVHDSPIYPKFVQIDSTPTSRSFVQVPDRDVDHILDELQKQGYLATAVCSYRYLKDSLYVINADFIRGTHEVVRDMDMSELQEKTQEMTDKRVKPEYICVSPGGGRFTGVWHRIPEYLWHFIIQAGTLEEIFSSDVANGQEGYYPDVLQVFRLNQTVTALCIWRKGYGVRYRIANGPSLIDISKELRHSPSLTLSSISALSYPRGSFYTVWKDNGLNWKGRNISRITKDNSTLPFIDWEVEKKMREEDVPSLSICIRRNGENRHTVAYGYADVKTDTAATPSHRYRIASVSKTFTSMAIQHLLNERKIFLEQPIFGPGAILGNDHGTLPYNRFLRWITVQHLLEHSTGTWDHWNKWEFESKNLTNRKDYLTWLLDTHPLLFPPGKQHIYSNIGYMILGRIIEKTTGVSYEHYVRNVLLKPLKIDAKIGSKERLVDEVTYYSTDNANPYFNWDPHRLDSAAGWVVNAEELVLLFEHLQQNRQTIYRTITTPSRTKIDYGKGVQLDRDGSIYHVGSLAGTEAIGFARYGLSCSIMVNVRGKDTNILTAWMLQLCKDVAARFEWGLEL